MQTDMDKISECGRISDTGQLLLPMERLAQEFVKHKGQRVVLKIEFATPGSSAAQLSYYYNYVVPTIVLALYEQGTRKSEKAVDKWLLEQYPGDKSDYAMGIDFEVEEGRQMTHPQMSDYLEWLKQFAAENLSVYIDDPRTI